MLNSKEASNMISTEILYKLNSPKNTINISTLYRTGHKISYGDGTGKRVVMAISSLLAMD